MHLLASYSFLFLLTLGGRGIFTLFEYRDVGQVTVVLGKVHTVTDHKDIRYPKTDITET